MKKSEPESSKVGKLIDYLQDIGLERRYHQVDVNRILIFKEIEKFALNLDENIENGNGYIIAGPVGTGKTSILSFFAQVNYQIRNVMMCKYQHIDEPVIANTSVKYSCLFISTSQLFNLFFNPDASYKKYESCDLLLLDDFGREYSHDFPISKFEDFVETRYSKMKSTVVTTNLTPDKLNSLPDYQRIIDRWKDTGMQLITINAESQRGKHEN